MSNFDPMNLQSEMAAEDLLAEQRYAQGAPASMPVASLLKLGRGALIPLDRKIGEPVDVVVNGRVVARGEVVVMDDDPSRLGISLTEVVGPSGAESLA
jgi:flagellar motor switch protein FliN/FliY